VLFGNSSFLPPWQAAVIGGAAWRGAGLARQAKQSNGEAGGSSTQHVSCFDMAAAEQVSGRLSRSRLAVMDVGWACCNRMHFCILRSSSRDAVGGLGLRLAADWAACAMYAI
jgi:hypothetical protein